MPGNMANLSKQGTESTRQMEDNTKTEAKEFTATTGGELWK